MRSYKQKSCGCRWRLIAAPALMTATLLTGCGRSVSIDSRPVVELSSALAEPPAALVAECAAPVTIPPGAISAGAVERLWAADRIELDLCGRRHAALGEFYRRRDAGLAQK